MDSEKQTRVNQIFVTLEVLEEAWRVCTEEIGGEVCPWDLKATLGAELPPSDSEEEKKDE